jgi:hypothetical protein
MASNTDYKRTTRGRAMVLYGNARVRSRKRNVEVFITSDWIEDHLKRGTCELTGLPFSFEPPPAGLTRRPDAPSVDRIDKTKPYTTENTRVILWAVNCALAEYGTETMLPILERMVNAIKKQPTPVSTKHTATSQEQEPHGSVHGARVGQDCDGSHHHRGEPEGQDSSDSTKESCRICMGTGVRKMATLETFYGGQDNGDCLCTAEEFAKRIRCICHQS